MDVLDRHVELGEDQPRICEAQRVIVVVALDRRRQVLLDRDMDVAAELERIILAPGLEQQIAGAARLERLGLDLDAFAHVGIGPVERRSGEPDPQHQVAVGALEIELGIVGDCGTEVGELLADHPAAGHVGTGIERLDILGVAAATELELDDMVHVAGDALHVREGLVAAADLPLGIGIGGGPGDAAQPIDAQVLRILARLLERRAAPFVARHPEQRRRRIRAQH